MLKKFIYLLCFIPAYSFAGGWTVQEANIEHIHYEGNFLLVKLEGGSFNLYDNCNTPNEVILEDETIRGDRQLSMLLSASLAGKSVSIYTAGCSTKWNREYPKVWSVRVIN